jgi:hypothetical protein
MDVKIKIGPGEDHLVQLKSVGNGWKFGMSQRYGVYN